LIAEEDDDELGFCLFDGPSYSSADADDSPAFSEESTISYGISATSTTSRMTKSFRPSDIKTSTISPSPPVALNQVPLPNKAVSGKVSFENKPKLQAVIPAKRDAAPDKPLAPAKPALTVSSTALKSEDSKSKKTGIKRRIL